MTAYFPEVPNKVVAVNVYEVAFIDDAMAKVAGVVWRQVGSWQRIVM